MTMTNKELGKQASRCAVCGRDYERVDTDPRVVHFAWYVSDGLVTACDLVCTGECLREWERRQAAAPTVASVVPTSLIMSHPEHHARGLRDWPLAWCIGPSRNEDGITEGTLAFVCSLMLNYHVASHDVARKIAAFAWWADKIKPRRARKAG